MVPRDSPKKLFPTLGPQVCAFMEENLVFGPGDLRGQPLVLDDERRMLIYRMYEVHPRRTPLAGRRRFQRAGISLAKGKAKTELAALIAACELHPEAPVRCVGWTKGGEPIGGPVDDPYIPLIAYTEQQSEDLAFGALRVILENSHLQGDFNIGLEKIERLKGDGVAQALSSNPSARDGARTTFCVFDETHRYTLQRLIDAHSTMLNNLPKRKKANAWALEITTAPEPGTRSVAEATMEYATAVHEGRIRNASFFFFHMQAGEHHDLTTADGRRAAVIEASGAAAEWRDIDGIVALYDDPNWDKAYWARVWCNQLVQQSTQAFNPLIWKQLKRERPVISRRDPITLGFDGAMFHDSTGLVGTHVRTGFQWVVGAWECPPGGELFDPPWQVPEDDVDALVRETFEHFNVWRLYADPPYWKEWIAKWVGEFGKERVIEWFTNRDRQMSAAIKTYENAMKTGAVTHDGDERFQRHIANARKKDLRMKDEKGQSLYVIRKERPDSPKKIDIAMSGCLSYTARMDAIAAGLLKIKVPSSRKGVGLVFKHGGMVPILDPADAPSAGDGVRA